MSPTRVQALRQAALADSVNPPTWLDEHGSLRAKQSVPTEPLGFYGWQPRQRWTAVKWCGHRVEGLPVPDADGRWRPFVVEGEAS